MQEITDTNTPLVSSPITPACQPARAGDPAATLQLTETSHKLSNVLSVCILANFPGALLSPRGPNCASACSSCLSSLFKTRLHQEAASHCYFRVFCHLSDELWCPCLSLKYHFRASLARKDLSVLIITDSPCSVFICEHMRMWATLSSVGSSVSPD